MLRSSDLPEYTTPTADLERGVYRALHNGVPVYFAIRADGTVLYGVHLPHEGREEAVVVTRLNALLEAEDPPAPRLRLLA